MGRADVMSEVPLLAVADPGLEGPLEDGDPRFRRQAGGRNPHPALAQRLAKRGGQPGELDQLPLVEIEQ